VPATRKVAMSPETVQTDGVPEVKVTASPELAVAIRVSGVPTTWEAGVAKVIVCGLTTTWPVPETVTVPVLLAWSTALNETLSAPPEEGVKLTVVANAEPPVMVEEQVPLVATVAVAVELVAAENVTDGAGDEEQPPSLRIVATGFKVDEGLVAVPTGDGGVEMLSRVICPKVSPPLALMTLE